MGIGFLVLRRQNILLLKLLDGRYTPFGISPPNSNARRPFMAVTRRTFVAAASALPFAIWFEKYANAFAPLIRHNATSLQGQAMLKIYAEAVCKMHTLPQTDPVAWLFQRYTHNSKGATTQA